MLPRTIVAGLVAGVLGLPAWAYPLTADASKALLETGGATGVEVEAIDSETYFLSGTKNGYNFGVRMMHCDTDLRCPSVMMFANFDMQGAPSIDEYVEINHYNDSRPYGRAYLLGEPGIDGYKVGVDYVVDISGESSFTADDVDRFFLIIDSFIEHMTAE